MTVLFGGYTASGYNGETWEWNGSVWTQRASSGPSPRLGSAMAYDSGRQVTVLFGGNDGGGSIGGTWEWNGNTWSQRTNLSPAKPSPRNLSAMVYDVGRGLSVLYGGYGGGADYSGDTWEYRSIRLGDMNTDGKLDGRDIQPFVRALLSNPSDPVAVYIADFDGSELVDLGDLDGFITALLSP